MTAVALSPINGNHLGGLDIRRFVQKYMGIGLGVSVALHLMLLATYQIAVNLTNHNLTALPTVYTLNTDIFLPPPSLGEKPTQPLLKISLPDLTVPLSAIPKPVIHDVPPDAPALPRQEEFSKAFDRMADSIRQGIGDAPLVIAQPIPDDDVIPPPTAFTPRELEPRLAGMIQPEYPAMAKSAGVAGKVWVQFYVDKNGDVREVRIVKSVPTGLGFEDETIKAIKQWKFIPAIQDKHPVGVWVGQTIVFKIQS